MNRSKMTNIFSCLMEKDAFIRGFFTLLLWIPGLMAGWFWATFILTFLM